MRPLIIGMNNPLSQRPDHALYPHPDGCTGWRLWQMLHARTGATRRQYLDAFERRNLVIADQWDRVAARARAFEMVGQVRDSGRTVVLLGQSVREAFHYVLQDESELKTPVLHERGLPQLLVHPQETAGCTWRQIPHPSGRNRWYNEPKNVEVVELLMEELYNGRE